MDKYKEPEFWTNIKCFLGSHRYPAVKQEGDMLRSVCDWCGKPMKIHKAIWDQMTAKPDPELVKIIEKFNSIGGK